MRSNRAPCAPRARARAGSASAPPASSCLWPGALQMRPSPPSVYGKAPNESVSSWNALNAISTRSVPPGCLRPSNNLSPMGPRKCEPRVPWTQWAGNGPPRSVNETWSCGW
eukprot:6205441-Pleurochrysis_carterae.AAC.7